MNQPKNTGSLRDINQPLYRYWEALYLCFFSPRIYRDVRLRWKGVNALYLLLAVALFIIPLSLKVTYSMTQYFDHQLVEPLKELPPIYIQNGVVSIDKPMPYMVKNKDNQVVAIVDTTGTVEGFSLKYPHMSILITKEAFYFREPQPTGFLGLKSKTTSNQKITKQKIAKTENQVLNMEQVINQSGVDTIKLAIQVLIYPILIGVFFSVYLIILLTFALLGQVVAQVFFGFFIKYKASCRIMALALTPQLIFTMVYMTFNLNVFVPGLISMILIAGYYCFGLACVKQDINKMVQQ